MSVLGTLAGLLFGGCQTGLALEKLVPDVSAAELSYERTGKFSNTQVHIVGLVSEPARVTAEQVEIRHSNAWMPKLELRVREYERLKPAAEAAEGGR